MSACLTDAFVVDDGAVAARAHLELDGAAQPVAQLVAIGERVPDPGEVGVEVDLPSDVHDWPPLWSGGGLCNSWVALMMCNELVAAYIG